MPEQIRVCTPEEFLAADEMERRKLVLAQIDATPESYDQRTWHRHQYRQPGGLTFSFHDNDRHEAEELGYTYCKSSFCIAGWTMELAGMKWIPDGGDDEDHGNSSKHTAAELLGLTPNWTGEYTVFGMHMRLDDIKEYLLS